MRAHANKEKERQEIHQEENHQVFDYVHELI